MPDYRSTNIKAEDIKDLPNNPILKGIPDNLKSIEDADKIERVLGQIMYSDHKHRRIDTFIKCKRCKDKVKKRGDKLKEFGFKDYEQYLTYKKVINLIKQQHGNLSNK